jgi:hypothetical protein
MSPKKAAAKKGAKQPLNPLPLVPEKELEAAKQKLADKEDNNRMRSQMKYWLEQRDQLVAYRAASAKTRKSYFDQWVANQMQNGVRSGKQSRTSSKSQTSQEEEEWMAKEEMINKLGPKRTESLINSGNLQFRACKKTGLDDEWNREYKQIRDKTINKTDETTAKQISSDMAALDDKTFKDLIDDITSMDALDNSSDKLADLPAITGVKTEGANPSGASTGSGAAGLCKPPEPEKEESGTYKALKTSPKAVVKNIQDAILELKEVWRESKDNRIAGVVHEDATKMLPKFARIYKSTETALVEKIDCDATLLALADKIDAMFTEYNALIEWHHRLMPKEARKKKAKIS